MTVRYTDEVATASFGGFFKLLRRWRGSIYKLLWKDLLVFLVFYYIVAACYIYVMSADQQRGFKTFAEYCETVTNLIPLELLLGYYVGVIISRWNAEIDSLPTPHQNVLLMTAYVYGQDELDLFIRRTVIRYCLLTYIMLLRNTCQPLKRRYPTLGALQKDGIVTEEELKILESIECGYSKYPIPICWAAALLMKAYHEGRISNEAGLYFINMTVTWAVYLYCIFAVFAAQSEHSIENYEWVVPFHKIIEFVVYVGWLKVAEMLINPFGDDDDDFDICGFVDRFLVWPSLVLKDVLANQPQLVRDNYWDTAQFELPYTAATISHKSFHVFELGSADTIELSKKMTTLLSTGDKMGAERSTLEQTQERDTPEDIHSANSLSKNITSWHVVNVAPDESAETHTSSRPRRSRIAGTITTIRDALGRRPTSGDTGSTASWPHESDAEAFSHEF